MQTIAKKYYFTEKNRSFKKKKPLDSQKIILNNASTHYSYYLLSENVLNNINFSEISGKITKKTFKTECKSLLSCMVYFVSLDSSQDSMKKRKKENNFKKFKKTKKR